MPKHCKDEKTGHQNINSTEQAISPLLCVQVRHRRPGRSSGI